MKQALFYSLKVWITAVGLGPVTTAIVAMIAFKGQFKDLNSIGGFILYSIPFGLIISFLSWFLFLLATMLLSLTLMRVNKMKPVLSVIACILTLLPFYLMFGHDDDAGSLSTSVWALCYCVVIVISIWFYNLGTSHEVVEAPNQV